MFYQKKKRNKLELFEWGNCTYFGYIFVPWLASRNSCLFNTIETIET
jgi:hypothetical protein